MQRYLSGLLLAIALLSLFPSFSLGKIRLLNVNFYFHRELSGIGNYRVLNTAYPEFSDNNSIVQSLPIGVWEVGDGWISPEVPQDLTLKRGYNFLFSVWGAGNGKATLFFKFYAYRNGDEHFLFTSNPSEQLIVNTSEMLWQHKTKEVTLEIKEGDRLVLRLFINVTVKGRFGLGYDCTQYPSYMSDPVETRTLLKSTQTINGLLAKKLSLDFQTGFYESVGASKGSSATTVYMGIRVWKRASNGTETEITAGTPVAQVSATANRAPIPPKTATWTCPLTPLVSTDSIVVRWYTRFDSGSWILLQTSTTEQLGAQSLDSATWTVIYYWQIINITLNATSNLYYDGDIETEYYYDTSIINFIWTEAITKTWKYISAWTFSLSARIWNQIAFWPFTLIAEAWSLVAFSSFDLVARIWNPISSWILTLNTRMWQNINFWISTLRSPGWNSVSFWIFELATLGWYSIAFWIFLLTPFSTGFLLIPLIFLVGVVLFLMAVALRKKFQNEF